MKTLLLAMALATGGTAHAQTDMRSRTVSVAGVDWSNSSQVDGVQRSIGRAARSVCTVDGWRYRDMACETAAIQAGMAQVDRIRARHKLATR